MKSKPKDTKSLTVSAGTMLGDYQFNVALETSIRKKEETVLVAPNKRIQKQWEKDYPGIRVILQADHKGYPVPAGLVQFGVSDLATPDRTATSAPSKSAPVNPSTKVEPEEQ